MTGPSSAKSRLAEYRAKRSFAKSPEPAGKGPPASGAKLRFVIQRHDSRHLHYDLRLELDGVFKSWAVTRGPSLDPHVKRLAVEVEDHPLEYGDFEGVIPKGQYGGGTVQLWDRGYWLAEGDPRDGLKKGDLKFYLQGERLRGGWVLVRMKNDRMGGKRTNWLLIKHRDDDAREDDDDALLKEPGSVASGRSLEAIAAGKGKAPTPFVMRRPAAVATARGTRSVKKPGKSPTAAAMPSFVEPQLCKPVQRPTSEPGWAHEVKFDGYRMQLRVQNGHARLAYAAGDRLDRQVPRHRRGGRRAARLHARRRDRGAGPARLPGLRGAAGGPVRTHDRRLDFLRLRPFVPRGRRFARAAVARPQGEAEGAPGRFETVRPSCATSSTSRPLAMRFCGPPARCDSRGSSPSALRRRTDPDAVKTGRKRSAAAATRW